MGKCLAGFCFYFIGGEDNRRRGQREERTTEGEDNRRRGQQKERTTGGVLVATKQGSITFKREFFNKKGRFLFKKVVFKRVVFDLI